MANLLKSAVYALTPQSLLDGFRNRREAAFIRSLPDRRYMEAKILPWLVYEGGSAILSVGCQFYTAHYEGLLRRMNAELSTIDIDPASARYGARAHRTCSVTEIAPTTFERQFDAVLLNGVIGWGLHAESEILVALRALRSVIRPGGIMAVGWNTDMSADPAAQLALAGFDTAPGPDIDSRVRCEGVTHVYDFVAVNDAMEIE